MTAISNPNSRLDHSAGTRGFYFGSAVICATVGRQRVCGQMDADIRRQSRSFQLVRRLIPNRT